MTEDTARKQVEHLALLERMHRIAMEALEILQENTEMMDPRKLRYRGWDEEEHKP